MREMSDWEIVETWLDSDEPQAVAALARLKEQLESTREKLHRCRSDYHAKVIALEKKLHDQSGVYRGGEPPDLPDDWVGEESSPASGERVATGEPSRTSAQGAKQSPEESSPAKRPS